MKKFATLPDGFEVCIESESPSAIEEACKLLARPGASEIMREANKRRMLQIWRDGYCQDVTDLIREVWLERDPILEVREWCEQESNRGSASSLKLPW